MLPASTEWQWLLRFLCSEKRLVFLHSWFSNKGLETRILIYLALFDGNIKSGIKHKKSCTEGVQFLRDCWCEYLEFLILHCSRICVSFTLTLAIESIADSLNPGSFSASCCRSFSDLALDAFLSNSGPISFHASPMLCNHKLTIDIILSTGLRQEWNGAVLAAHK